MAKIPRTLLAVLLITGCTLVQLPTPSDIPVDYEIKDVRRLKQNFDFYAGIPAKGTPEKSCLDTFLAEFIRRYYAPWKGNVPLSDIAESIRTMQEHAAREWYGENRRKVSRKDRDQILVNCDLERFPSMTRKGVVLIPTAVRVLPTARPFFKTQNDFPFDMLQNAGLKMNEPIHVLHLSQDGMWAFVETSDVNGWVVMRDIGYVDEATAETRMEKQQLIITKDKAPLWDETGVFQLAKFGTLLRITGETPDFWEVAVPVSSGGSAGEKRMKVSKDAAACFPLELSRENLRLVGNELIDRSYGWGELFQGRDCSALMRDYFIPFGIWLPRGSYNQINSGRKISLAGMEPARKEQYIRENGVPFITLLGLRGHIMLYIGVVENRPLVFHSFWGVDIRRNDGTISKQIVGKSVISTLTPGSELPVAGRSLLDKVDSMLVLGNRCLSTDKIH